MYHNVARSGSPSNNLGPSWPARTGQYSTNRNLNKSEEMQTIEEDREQLYQRDDRPLQTSANITHVPDMQIAHAPSMFRRLTNSIRTRGSVRGHRPFQNDGFQVLEENSADTVGVDLSSLEGMGFELREMGAPRSLDMQDAMQLDTQYVGAKLPMVSSSINSRHLPGYGMTTGARLERDNSVEGIQHRSSDLVRANTVRQIAQNLAEQRQQMVVCDLTSLEGTNLVNRQSTTFENILPDKESYLFPADPNIPDWKPFSMRAPYIIMLAVMAIALAGVQEFLCQLSLSREKETPPRALLNFNDVDNVSTWAFFVWKYLPTGIAIFYSALFSIMDFDIRRLEPFTQLAQPRGARAAASLNLDHLTMFQYIVPFNAARLGQWAVFASSVANILAATVAPALQNPSVDFAEVCQEDRSKCHEDAKKFWVRIDPPWSRAMSSVYLFVGLITLYLLFHLRRKSGLQRDPKGIAGIASMATKSHILRDFHGLDEASRGKIHKKLAHRTYILYQSSIWQGEYVAQPDKKEFRDSERRLKSPHPVMLRLAAGVPFITLMVLCLAAVPVISLTPARYIPNQLPWLPILVATIVKLIWSTFEADVRLMEPFYQLSRGNCKSRNSLTLDYQSLVYGWMPIRATFNKHFLVALVGLCSVLLDVFSVTVGSFSVDSDVFMKDRKKIGTGDETYISFYVSLFLSIAIMIFAISVAALVYARRRHPFLPREPSTIASVLAFLYNSRMLNDFCNTEHFTNKRMEEHLAGLDQRYGLGWFRGLDGEVHCAIDQEPMVSKYRHNTRYSEAVSGPLPAHDTYYGS